MTAGPIPPEVFSAIHASRQIALIGHVSPDADCLGAMVALGLALPELGKYPHLALPAGSVSRRMEALLALAGAVPASRSDLCACDLAVVLDTARDRRVNLDGKLEALPSAVVLNIDHHATNTLFGRWNWVEPHRSSTSEMAYELIVALGCQVTPTVATLLYAGIHTDTQGFSLANTTPRSLAIGHELAARGARVADVCETLHRSHSRGEFELLSQVYRNARVSSDGHVAWSTLSHAEILATGCDAGAIDDQVEIPRSIEGISIAILFTEGDPGIIRVNFRGERGTPVLALAEQFGGGGHQLSAGARVRGELESVVGRVVEAALGQR